MLKEHVAHEPHMRWECRSSAYYQNTALFPLVDLFQRLLQFQAEETPDAKLAKLEHALSQYRLPLEESVPLFAPLLSLSLPEDRYPPAHFSPQRQRQKTLETIVAILLELAEHQPVLFILEDLHWTDPTTLELLEPADRPDTYGFYLGAAHLSSAFSTCLASPFVSHRNDGPPLISAPDGADDDPCGRGKNVTASRSCTSSSSETDGVPLFVEEMTKAMLESGHLKEVDEHYALTGSFSTLAIPATLQDSLMADWIAWCTAKAVAQYAAVIGRQFSYALLQAVAQLDAAMLQQELRRLVEAEIVYQRGVPPQATYTFKHALIQDTAYASLLKSTRQQYHQRIAQVLGSPVSRDR